MLFNCSCSKNILLGTLRMLFNFSLFQEYSARHTGHASNFFIEYSARHPGHVFFIFFSSLCLKSMPRVPSRIFLEQNMKENKSRKPHRNIISKKTVSCLVCLCFTKSLRQAVNPTNPCPNPLKKHPKPASTPTNERKIRKRFQT